MKYSGLAQVLAQIHSTLKYNNPGQEQPSLSIIYLSTGKLFDTPAEKITQLGSQKVVYKFGTANPPSFLALCRVFNLIQGFFLFQSNWPTCRENDFLDIQTKEFCNTYSTWGSQTIFTRLHLPATERGSLVQT